LAFAVEINEFADEAKEVIEMATSTGDSASHVRWGEFGFEVEGTPDTLVVYRSLDSEDFFLPLWTVPLARPPTAAGDTWN